ncbi:MAG: putative glycoprotein [Wenzhou bat rhabdovirus 2]|nr:MAG: putative glycoprotein [Wenzhou bat rhabdovirus 2]
MLTLLAVVLGLVNSLALELGPFPIHICGANRRPTPFALPSNECRHSHRINQPEHVGKLSLLTRANIAIPLSAYRCHAVISYASCMEWFLGVKDVRYWTEGDIVSKEECMSSIQYTSSTPSHLKSPRAKCIWWGNNTRQLRQVILEPVTVFANILTDAIVLPGHNSTWYFLNESWHFSDAEYYYLNEDSKHIYELRHRASEIEVECQVSTHRVVCPSEAITFWLEDLTHKTIKGKSYYEISPSLYMKHDLASWLMINTSLKTLQEHRQGDPTIQYVLMRTNEVREGLLNMQENLGCALNNFKKMTALAIAPINPVMAGMIYLGERQPGVSISQGGLIKYACSRVTHWEIDSNQHGFKDLPIKYLLPTYETVMTGFLDSTSLYIRATSVPGIPPQFLLVNSSHIYNIKTNSFILPLKQDLLVSLAEYPIQGVASYNEDELEALSSITHVTEWLTRVTQPENRRYSPGSHTVFALKDSPARDVVRTSQAWFANLIPSTLSTIAEVIGSLITIMIATQLIISATKWLSRSVQNKFLTSSPPMVRYDNHELT